MSFFSCVVINASPITKNIIVHKVQNGEIHEKEPLFIHSLEWMKMIFDEIIRILQFPTRIPVNPEVENFPLTVHSDRDSV